MRRRTFRVTSDEEGKQCNKVKISKGECLKQALFNLLPTQGRRSVHNEGLA
jgi:hypothetical protein